MENSLASFECWEQLEKFETRSDIKIMDQQSSRCNLKLGDFAEESGEFN